MCITDVGAFSFSCLGNLGAPPSILTTPLGSYVDGCIDVVADNWYLYDLKAQDNVDGWRHAG